MLLLGSPARRRRGPTETEILRLCLPAQGQRTGASVGIYIGEERILEGAHLFDPAGSKRLRLQFTHFVGNLQVCHPRVTTKRSSATRVLSSRTAKQTYVVDSRLTITDLLLPHNVTPTLPIRPVLLVDTKLLSMTHAARYALFRPRLTAVEYAF